MNEIAERLRAMHELAADSCDPEYNRALLDAADEIDRLTQAVEEIGDMVKARDAQIFVLTRKSDAASSLSRLSPSE